MPLLKCPECFKEISDKAKVCPNCGFPFTVRNWKLIRKLFIWLLVIPVLIILLSIFYYSRQILIPLPIFGLIPLFLLIGIFGISLAQYKITKFKFIRTHYKYVIGFALLIALSTGVYYIYNQYDTPSKNQTSPATLPDAKRITRILSGWEKMLTGREESVKSEDFPEGLRNKIKEEKMEGSNFWIPG